LDVYNIVTLNKLKIMTTLELKAQAYDILAQIEYLNKKLQETNQLIAQKIQEENGSDGDDSRKVGEIR
jgi:hypothetical protein